MSWRSQTSGDIEPLFEPIGTRDIISTPPETTRSSWPDQTAAAALKFVCIEEPHCRSTVVPATDTGQPAVSATLRPMFQACSSTCVTQPHWTSSTSAGSTPLRVTSAFTTCADSSSPRMWESVPFFFPIGLRTASTIIAFEGFMQETVPRSMLRKNAKIELLKRVPLFERCSQRELAQIAALADELDLPTARNLTSEGSGGFEFIVLVQGEADVIRGVRKVNELGPGDFVGEIALITGEPRTATVKTRGPSRILVLTASGFRTLMNDVPSIKDKVLAALTARIPDEYE